MRLPSSSGLRLPLPLEIANAFGDTWTKHPVTNRPSPGTRIRWTWASGNSPRSTRPPPRSLRTAGPCRFDRHRRRRTPPAGGSHAGSGGEGFPASQLEPDAPCPQGRLHTPICQLDIVSPDIVPKVGDVKPAQGGPEQLLPIAASIDSHSHFTKPICEPNVTLR